VSDIGVLVTAVGGCWCGLGAAHRSWMLFGAGLAVTAVGVVLEKCAVLRLEDMARQA
jgi:hypothetical protein